jgi:hypothetical protein
MSRTKGSTNIAPFGTRTEIPVSSAQAIQLRGANLGPIEQFKATVDHQRNYLKWLQSRHDKIIELNAEVVQGQTGQPPTRKGAKDATHRKYLWFAECMALLDVINAFEFFYKSSCIDLAMALANIIPSSQIKGSIEARFIWESQGYSPQHLLFEHRLFHDLKYVNEATQMLIGKSHYQLQASNDTYRCIHAIFQIRHTLSHNSGQMTQSDATKLRALGFAACPDGAIDPGEGSFREAVFRFLINEATSFTSWLERETLTFIHANAGSDGFVSVHKSHLLKLFNGSTAFDALNLIPEHFNASI